MKKVVSIISPCYNGEAYISRFLESVLSQRYRPIELIIINDGSTDNTEHVLCSFKERLEQEGINYIYLQQENKGQSAAINLALPIFTGEYVAFVDSDDILPPDAIEKKVDYMEQRPQIGLLINKVKVLDFETLSVLGTMERKQPMGKDHLFADLISGNNVFYTPGGYFWRANMFRDSMPKPLQIAAPREIGQNFQLILPIAYKYPVGYLDDYLYFYLIRPNSHSRTKHTYEQILKNWGVAHDVLSSVADDIERDSAKRKHIQNLIDSRYYHELMSHAYNYKNKTDFKTYRNQWIRIQAGNNKTKAFLLQLNLWGRRHFNKAKAYVSTLLTK